MMRSLRWSVVAVGSLIAVAACGSGNGDGAADDGSGSELSVRFSMPTDPSHAFQRCGAETFVSSVEESTGGAISVDVYSGDQLGDETAQFNSTIDGSIDMSVINPGHLAERHEPLSVLSAAYLFNDIDSMLEVFRGDVGEELWSGLEESISVEVLGTWPFGVRHLTTTDTEVHTPEDLSGVKVRAADAPIWIANTEALGATPTPMALGEVYLGLQQGVIDGQENPITMIEAQSFDEVQQFVILTGHVVQGNQVLINSDRWSQLSGDQQQIITDAVQEAGDSIEECLVEEQDEILADWEQTEEMTIVDEIDVAAFRSRAEEMLLAEYGQRWDGLYEQIRQAQG